MPGDTLSAHFPEDQKQRIVQYKDDYDISISQAIVRTCDRGLIAYGYTNGTTNPQLTRLTHAVQQLASATVGAAAVLVFLSITHFTWLIAFVPPLLAAAAGLMMIQYWEPRISVWLHNTGHRLAASLGVDDR